MIKLVALDLDDTLLNDELEIPQENIEAIDRAREHGVDVIIATGRMYCQQCRMHKNWGWLQIRL